MVRIARFCASFGGIGFVPKAPGTAGSLAALVIAWFLPTVSIGLVLAIVTATFLGGLVVTQVATQGHGDPSWIVIDEVVGMWLALTGLPHTLEVFVVTFFAFRLFDIYKPCGINALQRLPGAWGVMLDDVAAGLATAALMRLVLYIMPF